MKKFLVFCFMFMFAFTVSAQDRERGGRGPGDMEKRYEEMKKELGLNEQQLDSIKAIDRDFFVKIREQREKNGNDRERNREEMMKMNEQRSERVKMILTEDQYAKYQEMESKRRQRGRQN